MYLIEYHESFLINILCCFEPLGDFTYLLLALGLLEIDARLI